MHNILVQRDQWQVQKNDYMQSVNSVTSNLHNDRIQISAVPIEIHAFKT